MRLIKHAATVKKDTKRMKSGSSVNCVTSGFMKLVLKSLTNIYHVLFHYLVGKFPCLYKSVLLFTVQWKMIALIFPQNYLLKPTLWQSLWDDLFLLKRDFNLQYYCKEIYFSERYFSQNLFLWFWPLFANIS